MYNCRVAASANQNCERDTARQKRLQCHASPAPMWRGTPPRVTTLCNLELPGESASSV